MAAFWPRPSGPLRDQRLVDMLARLSSTELPCHAVGSRTSAMANIYWQGALERRQCGRASHPGGVFLAAAEASRLRQW